MKKPVCLVVLIFLLSGHSEFYFVRRGFPRAMLRRLDLELVLSEGDNFGMELLSDVDVFCLDWVVCLCVYELI